MTASLGPLALNGPLASERGAFARFRRHVDIAGKRILEIGGCLPESWTNAARQWHSVDPLNPRDQMPTGHVMRHRGVAESLPPGVGVVDAVFACDSFQHVTDVAAVYAECSRILKPGGIVYANFGPVWSAPDGAHLENIVAQGRRWDFWSGQLLPSWSHLLLPPDRMRYLATRLLGDEVGSAVATYIQASTWINRTTLRRHLEAPSLARFETVSLRGCQKFGYRSRPVAAPADVHELHSEAEVILRCREKFGLTENELRVRDLEIVVQKPHG